MKQTVRSGKFASETIGLYWIEINYITISTSIKGLKGGMSMGRLTGLQYVHILYNFKSNNAYLT